MDHKDYLVDLLDDTGRVIGQKPRHAISKRQDIYHSIHVLMLTPRRELVLSQIPERQDLPNVYARRLGATVATIRRSDESAAEAATRALERELFLRDKELKPLGEGMFSLNDGFHAFMTAYWVEADPPEHYSTIDIDSLKLMPVPRFAAAMQRNPDHFSATLREVWKRWGGRVVAQ